MGSLGRGLRPTPIVRRDPGNSRVAGSTGHAQLAGQLLAEFNAPVGVMQPDRSLWLLHLGAPAVVFPQLDRRLTSVVAGRGRVALWRGDGVLGLVWMLVPVATPEGTLVAVLGFLESARPVGPASSIRWGPPCPEAALKAWGQSVADRFARECPSPTGSPGPADTMRQVNGRSTTLDPAHDGHSDRNGKTADPGLEGCELRLVARMIRRLRVSDAPTAFQQMVTSELRSALRVQALAWVPTPEVDPVICADASGRFSTATMRRFIPSAEDSRGVVHIENRAEGQKDPNVLRSLAVAADSQGAIGWLIALNPLDGGPFEPSDAHIVLPAASLIATQQANARVYADLKELLFGVIRALTAAIDAKDPYTSGHSERVARIAVRIGEEMGLSATKRGDLYLIGLLHDIGKIGIDDAVLKKPGPLTAEEYRQIQSHVELGMHILADLKKLKHLLPGVLHHHECLDGSGYPSGLVGEAIPLESRILAVADTYDAMSSTRPYRRRLTPSQIEEALRKGSGVQWDSRVVEALFRCRTDLELIRQKGLGESLQLVVNETLGRNVVS